MHAALTRVDPATPSPARFARAWGGAAITGALAGIAGAWVFSRFRVWRAADDRATAAIAQAIARRLVGTDLTRDELAVIVPVLRCAYGTAAGAAYAVLRPPESPIIVAGAAFGLLLWILSDLAILPAIRQASDGGRRPESPMAVSVSYHLVFGVTTDVVQRTVDGLAVFD